MSVTIFGPDGSATDYRTVSERLPEFEKLFPVEEGFRVIRSHVSAKDFGSEIYHLYEKAIENGHSPRDVGLPFIDGFSVIFKAELFKNDVLIRNASAYKQITNTKDWEAGETAAFQRLMAACGLGGTDMDADDRYDRVSSGLEVPPASQPNAQPQAQPANAPVSEPAPEPEPSPQVDDTGKTVKEPEEVSEPKPEQGTESIRPQLLNQLAHVAKLAGEQIPNVTSEKEAKAEIKRLNRLSRTS